MGYHLTSTRVLKRRIDAIANDISKKSFKRSLIDSSIYGLVSISQLDLGETTFSYTPKVRRTVFGGAGTSSCFSDPQIAITGGETEYAGKISGVDSSYQVCINDCKKKSSIREIVKEGEKACSDYLSSFLSSKLWTGQPKLSQFGVLNHPMAENIVSPKNGTGNKSGIQFKTNNQAMIEIKQLIKGMVSPVVLAGEKTFNSSLGLGNTQNDKGCATRASCIEGLLKAQQDVNFGKDDYLKYSSIIDDANDNIIFLAYDKSSLSISSTPIIQLDSTIESEKVVRVTRGLSSGGLMIAYAGSIRILREDMT